MYDNYVKLNIVGLTQGRELHEAHILVLCGDKHEGYFPILLDNKGYQYVDAALHHKDFAPSKLMNKLARRMGMSLIGVRIMRPLNGETQALLDFELINDIVSITTSAAEAIVAALEMHCDLYVQRSQFEKQIMMQPSHGGGMALPLTAMNNELLKKAMLSAVSEDKFELAGILRDELRKRSENKEHL